MKKIHIVLAANVAYYQHVCVLIVSLLENNRNSEFVIYVLTDDKYSPEKEKILSLASRYENIEIDFREVDPADVDFFSMSEYCFQTTIQTYYRCLIPDLFPDLSKVLYLDSDMVVDGNIDRLWEIDIDEYYAAGVREIDENNPLLERSISILSFDKAELYVNAGVLLLNLDRMRKHGIPVAFADTAKKFGNSLPMQDQDVINFTLRGGIKEIDPRFNWTHMHLKPAMRGNISCSDIVIHHYTSGRKPWNPRLFCRHVGKSLYFHYLSNTPYRKFTRRFRIEYFFRQTIMGNIIFIMKKTLPKQVIAGIRDRFV